MAKQADDSSVRQRAMVLIHSLTDLEIPRNKQLEQLQTQFDIGLRYAETLFSTYRTEQYDNMSKVFTIMDAKNGVEVTPYLKVENVFKIREGDSLTAAAARKVYQAVLRKKIEHCKETDIEVYQVIDGDGDSAMPVMQVTRVANPRKTDTFTPANAKKVYIAKHKVLLAELLAANATMAEKEKVRRVLIMSKTL